MRNKNDPIRHRKAAKVTASTTPARKTRTKTRKPKYLSLIKLELSPPQQNKKQTKTKTSTPKKKKPNKKMPYKQQKQQQQQQQLNLFPLHPENNSNNNIAQDRDMQDDLVTDHVALLFETATDDSSTTLHGLLDTTTTTTTTTTSEEGPLSPSLTYVSNMALDHESEARSSGGGGGGPICSLVRTAMRRCSYEERDAIEERWVSYWEVVEKREQEEVSSCCDGYGGGNALGKMMQLQGDDDHKKSVLGLVGLKLDYQEILDAWSDKGSLYIEGESPQTVPDLHDGSSALMDGWGDAWNLWRVPEMGGMRMKDNGAEESRKLGQREASVLRYKEKRQSRLFSKRIRYEVRKLNAEKRPRLKGRFVKRSGEV